MQTLLMCCSCHNPLCVLLPTCHRGACFVLIPTTDLVFYAMGSGEYDEMSCGCQHCEEQQQQQHNS
jgi:hypothetical protein